MSLHTSVANWYVVFRPSKQFPVSALFLEAPNGEPMAIVYARPDEGAKEFNLRISYICAASILLKVSPSMLPAAAFEADGIIDLSREPLRSEHAEKKEILTLDIDSGWAKPGKEQRWG
jgi:hypothetical protein